MKILFIASEAFPLAKVGGLANVTSSLAIALHDSGHEPCGLGQLVAMRYGAIPVVRYTGGLADAVKDVAAIDGNGFLFQNYTVRTCWRLSREPKQASITGLNGTI